MMNTCLFCEGTLYYIILNEWHILPRGDNYHHTYMFTLVLEELGLAKNEALLYEALLKLRQASVSQLSYETKIHRRNVYDTIDRLIKKGLAFHVMSKGDNFYEAVDPAKLVEIIEEKRNKLDGVMDQMVAFYNETPHIEAAFIYKGVEGFKNYLRDSLAVHEDMFLLGAKGCWLDPRLQSFIGSFLQQAKEKDIVYHHLFDYEVKRMLPDLPAQVGGPYKFLPQLFSTPSMVDVFGDHVVSFTGAGIGKISDDITIFVNISRPLATSYKTWFQFMFEQCPEV